MIKRRKFVYVICVRIDVYACRVTKRFAILFPLFRNLSLSPLFSHFFHLSIHLFYLSSSTSAPVRECARGVSTVSITPTYRILSSRCSFSRNSRRLRSDSFFFDAEGGTELAVGMIGPPMVLGLLEPRFGVVEPLLFLAVLLFVWSKADDEEAGSSCCRRILRSRATGEKRAKL